MIQAQKNNMQLLQRELTPTKAKDSINGIIEKINQQLNQERLSLFETGDNGDLASSLQEQVAQLKSQKHELNERITQAEDLGCNVKFSLKFELNLIK